MAENAIVVAGWALMPPSNDVDEPRVRDTDLAERLGYAEPRMIRRLIKRMAGDGEFANPSAIQHRSIVDRYESRPGVWQQRQVSEYWLTKEEALLVCSRSDADRAKEVRAMLVAVFLAYESGKLVPAAPPPPLAAITAAEMTAIMAPCTAALTQVTASLATVNTRLDALEAAAPHARQPLGVIGRIGSAVIRGRLRDYARLLEVPGKRGSFQSHLRAADQELRERIGYPMSRGSGWDMLDQSLEGAAARHLHQMIERAQRYTGERSNGKQTTLWPLTVGRA